MLKKQNPAFTLLEILLVVGIIAILAGIVIIAINPGKQLASVRNTQRLSDLKQLNNAITQFYIDKGTYPASTTLSTTSLKEICNTGSVSGATSSVDNIPCGSLTNLSELVPTYIVAIPVDPSGASSTLTFIPTAYAAVGGTGYKIMRTAANQIVEQAPLSELNVQVAIGTVPTVPWVPISGLLAHWKLNDNAANTNVLDNTGTYNGTANFTTNANTTAGVIGSALSFNGANVITSGLSLPTGANPKSVSLWFKTPDVTARGWMFAGGTENTYQAFGLFMNGGAPVIYFFGFSSGDLPFNTVPVNNTWYHIVVTYNGTTVTTYVNGSYDNSATRSLNTGNSTIQIGKRIGGAHEAFTGSIDDVRVYNRALTPSEVSQIYNGGAGTELE